MLLLGDCRVVLPTLPEGSVQCVVTSPPYWRLRDYGVDGQIGLEPTPEQYVETMVGVFREVRRVLREDGTLWLNLGDSYAGSTMQGGNNGINASGGVDGFKQRRQFERKTDTPGLKPKDLVGMPWRVAFALQADGADLGALRGIEKARQAIYDAYAATASHPPPDRVVTALDRLAVEEREAKGASWWLRSDIIWAKPNPMPESVTDRPTKAHEYVFLLTKSARYFYDAEAVREPNTPGGAARITASPGTGSGMSIGVGGQRYARLASVGTEANGRNMRSVWTIPSAPFPEAHFATFPPALADRCILAGSKMGDTVLDPFGGSGTVGACAEALGRHSILIELSPEYVAMAQRRTAQRGLFTQAG